MEDFACLFNTAKEKENFCLWKLLCFSLAQFFFLCFSILHHIGGYKQKSMYKKSHKNIHWEIRTLEFFYPSFSSLVLLSPFSYFFVKCVLKALQTYSSIYKIWELILGYIYIYKISILGVTNTITGYCS